MFHMSRRGFIIAEMCRELRTNGIQCVMLEFVKYLISGYCFSGFVLNTNCLARDEKFFLLAGKYGLLVIRIFNLERIGKFVDIWEIGGVCL